MFGRDRTNGIGAELFDDLVELIAEKGQNEVNSPIAQQLWQHLISTSSAVEPHQRKRNRKYPPVEDVAKKNNTS